MAHTSQSSTVNRHNIRFNKLTQIYGCQQLKGPWCECEDTGSLEGFAFIKVNRRHSLRKLLDFLENV